MVLVARAITDATPESVGPVPLSYHAPPVTMVRSHVPSQTPHRSPWGQHSLLVLVLVRVVEVVVLVLVVLVLEVEVEVGKFNANAGHFVSLAYGVCTPLVTMAPSYHAP